MKEKDVVEQLTPTARAFVLQVITDTQEAMKQRDELLKALVAALEWIDAVPSEMALPAMPGFDRDEVNNLISSIKGGAE